MLYQLVQIIWASLAYSIISSWHVMHSTAVVSRCYFSVMRIGRLFHFEWGVMHMVWQMELENIEG